MLPDVDDCSTSPCENGAICVDEHSGYTCQCTEQWLGDNCTGMCKMATPVSIMISDDSNDDLKFQSF